MLGELVSSVSYKLSPRLTQFWQDLRLLRAEARRLRALLDAEPDLSRKVDLLLANKPFFPTQKRHEFQHLLMRIQLLQARAVCEIGGANGGSLAGFCEVSALDAHLLSIDVGYTRARRLANRRLARANQEITCWASDSHEPGLARRVEKHFRGRPLDFLLIDGDHSLEGVTQDYETFAPMVRPGGLIALHDIVPDSSMRSGIPSSSVAGGVPLFWHRLRSCTGNTVEIVEDPGQDGYGFGLVLAGSPEAAARR